MPKHREPLPDDLKELIALCRAGRLFEVQKWIAAGKRFTLPDGNFLTSPFLAALRTGFHSLIEVLLKAGVDQEDKDHALQSAIWDKRLDLIELLVEHGANFKEAEPSEVISSRNPPIIRWFIDHGLDMESGYPIAHALKNRQREFLGIYMGLREKVPTARFQASMALRCHARQGNMKWISLLLWGGADPRAKVPDLESSPSDEYAGTALEDAVIYSKFDVIRKFEIDPARDDVTHLLGQCWMCSEPEIVRMLLEAGADPNAADSERNPMTSLFRNFEWSQERSFSNQSPEIAIKCIELAASRGGRWRPNVPYVIRYFRRMIGKAEPYSIIPQLVRIVNSGAIEQEVFKELMKTPQMKAVLSSSAPGSVLLREFAGHGPKHAFRFRPRKSSPLGPTLPNGR